MGMEADRKAGGRMEADKTGGEKEAVEEMWIDRGGGEVRN
jgi:hypothetical protein